ncbi:MAG TPA: hypothetical protein DDW52_14955 [Planctomycetaceae bacterium]|nr:hypothetical protein [Planctomycetaceae bacterium]
MISALGSFFLGVGLAFPAHAPVQDLKPGTTVVIELSGDCAALMEKVSGVQPNSQSRITVVGYVAQTAESGSILINCLSPDVRGGNGYMVSVSAVVTPDQVKQQKVRISELQNLRINRWQRIEQHGMLTDKID